MAEYSKVKTKPLSFKGLSKSEKDRRKDARKKFIKEQEIYLISEDMINESKAHGGWWIIDRFENISSISFQHDSGSYLACLENGDIVLGPLHEPEEPGPKKEEIFTLVPVAEHKYDRYVSATSQGVVFSRPEAISPQESLEIVINDGRVAIQSHYQLFLGCSHGAVTATSPTASSLNEIFTMRTNKPYKQKKELKETELDDPTVVEMTLVKKYQNFGNQRYFTSKESNKNLYLARESGKLSEEMLDRRCRMKSDRRCK